MQFTGTVTGKSEKIYVGAKNTPKITLKLREQKDQYPNEILIDFIGEDKVNLVDDLSIGDFASVEFNLKVTEYNGREYNNINGWKILEMKLAPQNDPDESLPF